MNPFSTKPSIFKGIFSGDNDSKTEKSTEEMKAPLIPTRTNSPDPYTVTLSESSINNYSNLLNPKEMNGISEEERLALESLAFVPVPEEMNFNHY